MRVDQLNIEDYLIKNVSEVFSPQLLIYPNIVKDNIQEIIKLAGGVNNIWPHIKSFKSKKVVSLIKEAGIRKFKCATFAEAEILGQLEVKDICLAYPLIGPNIKRFSLLVKKFPKSTFWAIGSDLSSIKELESNLKDSNLRANLLIDVDFGQERTGVPIGELVDFLNKIELEGYLSLKGLHCYDGDIHDSNIDIRENKVEKNDQMLLDVLGQVENKMKLDTLILGGSPTFVCHTHHFKKYFSPGTIFLNDMNYFNSYSEINCKPAALVIGRVVNRVKNKFTIDVGYKSIASDNIEDNRGYILGYGDKVKSCFQNEEHWVWESKDKNFVLPEVGEEVYILPYHICPTVALYPNAKIVQDKKVVESWDIEARDRIITV